MAKNLSNSFAECLKIDKSKDGYGLVVFISNLLIYGNFQTDSEKIRCTIEAAKFFHEMPDPIIEPEVEFTQADFEKAAIAWREKNKGMIKIT